MKKKISQFELTNYILLNVNASNSGLDSKESFVLVTLSRFLNSSTLQCNPSMATLADCCALSIRTINVAISSLLEKGYLTHVKGGLVGTLRKANAYTFVYEKIYSCVKAEWVAPAPPESNIPAPPDRGVVVVAEAEVEKPVKGAGGNTDGSSRFHSNGTRCYSYDDHRRATTKANEEDTNAIF